MKLEIAVAIMIILDVILFLTQTAVINVAAEEKVAYPVFYTYKDSVLYSYDEGNYTLTNDISKDLPSAQGAVLPDSGSFFSDLFSSMKNWFLDFPGVKYVVSAITAVPNTLKMMGLPAEVSFALGAIWHVITFVLLIMWLFNR
jgi:hypothetical protein